MKLETLSPELQQYEPLLARMQQQMQTELVRRASENRIDSYYPDGGPLRRELYPKHLEFFRAGIEHRERCFLAANRVGKTEGVGGYEQQKLIKVRRMLLYFISNARHADSHSIDGRMRSNEVSLQASEVTAPCRSLVDPRIQKGRYFCASKT
jgi:hypothetical protein